MASKAAVTTTLVHFRRIMSASHKSTTQIIPDMILRTSRFSAEPRSIHHRTRSFATSNHNKNNDNNKSGGNASTTSNKNDIETAYVHPLSRIVLEHLQTSWDGWVKSTGLDTGLTIHNDGTFVLKFPPIQSSADEEEEEDGGKIWTSYEPTEKKHWLTVHRGDLVGRYLLQDNLKPAWHSDRRSTPEKVQDAVDEMIRKLSQQQTGSKP